MGVTVGRERSSGSRFLWSLGTLSPSAGGLGAWLWLAAAYQQPGFLQIHTSVCTHTHGPKQSLSGRTSPEASF